MIREYIVNNRFIINKIIALTFIIVIQIWFKLNHIYYFTFSDQNVNNEPVVCNQEYSTKYFSELYILMHRTLLTTLRDHVSN